MKDILATYWCLCVYVLAVTGFGAVSVVSRALVKLTQALECCDSGKRRSSFRIHQLLG
jgi:hypothetical protein